MKWLLVLESLWKELSEQDSIKTEIVINKLTGIARKMANMIYVWNECWINCLRMSERFRSIFYGVLGSILLAIFTLQLSKLKDAFKGVGKPRQHLFSLMTKYMADFYTKS